MIFLTLDVFQVDTFDKIPSNLKSLLDISEGDFTVLKDFLDEKDENIMLLLNWVVYTNKFRLNLLKGNEVKN